MAYIDPDGMFGGDRMAQLSDSAKFAWPWFWCASNTMGRVELNYQAFVRGPFRQFRCPPTEAQFWEWVAEFHEAHLLFAYQAAGSAWGQWDVSERYLPDYKTKADRRTIPPNAQAFLAWREEYREAKVSNLSSKCRVFNLSEKIPAFSKKGEIFPSGEERRGEERREPTPPAATASEGEKPPSKASAPKAAPDAWDAWWEAWWNKTAKAAGRKAWQKAAAKHGAEFLLAQVVADRARFESTSTWDWRRNLHPATWLNGERWEDQLPPQANAAVVGGWNKSAVRPLRIEPQPATEQAKREALEWIAENDPDPAAREDAKKRLA